MNVVFLTYLYLAKLLKIFVRPFPKVSAEWSPNGRYLLTATTAPRLNVDNGYKLWRYNGELLQHVDFEFAEVAAERNLLHLRQRLAAEEDDAP